MENISGFWPSTAAPSANDNDEGSFDDGDTLRLGSPSPQRAWNELEPPRAWNELERPCDETVKGKGSGKKRPASQPTAPIRPRPRPRARPRLRPRPFKRGLPLRPRPFKRSLKRRTTTRRMLNQRLKTSLRYLA